LPQAHLLPMIEQKGLKFNCCESTLIRVNEKHPLPGLGSPVMRVASNFGGGVAGWGSACGAVTGAAMAFGLLMGTEGDETPEGFKQKRDRMRALTQVFNKAFEEKWGNVNCYGLLGVNTRTPEGKARYEEMKARGETHCEDYVKWAAEKVLSILSGE
jgi:C_GCAxxG_C_C family probable redox protein